MNKKKYKNKYRIDSIRLQNWDYSANGYYFLTMCVKNRECILGDIVNHKMILNKYGDIVKYYWEDLINHYDNIILDEFIIMPNHFHGIVIINNDIENQTPDNPSVEAKTVEAKTVEAKTVEAKTVVEAIHELPQRKPQRKPRREIRRKMLIPKIIGRFKMNTAKAINIERDTKGKPFWQRDYYDRIIRTENELRNVRNYIKNNPKKWKEES